MHMACRIPNPHAQPQRRSSTAPLWGATGAVQQRLTSGRARVDITATEARSWDFEKSGIPRIDPGPLPREIICGRWLIALVGDEDNDVRIVERQDPHALVVARAKQRWSRLNCFHSISRLMYVH